jgi:hypothetical protein
MKPNAPMSYTVNSIVMTNTIVMTNDYFPSALRFPYSGPRERYSTSEPSVY